MPTLTPTVIAIPPRCFYRENPADLAGCGAPAVWVRPSNCGFPAGYYCDQHRSPGDEPIGEAYVYSRVSLIAEILIAGVEFGATAAKSEAIERIGAAVESVGGLFSLVDATAVLTRAPRQAPAGATIARGGAGFGRGWRS